MTRLLIIILGAALAGCNDIPTYAPVYDIDNIEPVISHYASQPAGETVAVTAPAWQSPVDTKSGHKYRVMNKGVDIYGIQGEPIYAAADGKVVFCGSGLRGYGRLIIIKHNNKYLTVYAHTQDVQIKPGDWVKAGQVVASMGNTGVNKPKLHFEIRYMGKPLNPLILLQRNSV